MDQALWPEILAPTVPARFARWCTPSRNSIRRDCAAFASKPVPPAVGQKCGTSSAATRFEQERAGLGKHRQAPLRSRRHTSAAFETGMSERVDWLRIRVDEAAPAGAHRIDDGRAWTMIKEKRHQSATRALLTMLVVVSSSSY